MILSRVFATVAAVLVLWTRELKRPKLFSGCGKHCVPDGTAEGSADTVAGSAERSAEGEEVDGGG